MTTFPDLLSGKTILITGGTGSFGSKMLERLLSNGSSVDEIRIFSRDELKQEEMRVRLKHPKVKFYIGDVRDRSSVDHAMHGVNLVFHAAALKQVPSCEFFPIQAVMTNVMGSHNVLESAISHGVRKVVCLSTDKAVSPVNAMGMTKALMEKVALAAARSRLEGETTICSVRYGNVMYSRGSVIPLFVGQIKSGLPLTLTDPQMTRFLLSLQVAIELVLYAWEHGEQGDIFVRKAPACTVEVLAQALLNLFQADNPLHLIGERHGEKTFEVLASVQELRKAQDMGDYYRVRMDDRDLNYDKYFTEGEAPLPIEDYTSHNTQRLEVAEVERLLLSLPEMQRELDAWRSRRPV